MKLMEAFQIIQKPVRTDVEPLRVFLACGFTPLHLETFLVAHLRQLQAERAVTLSTGLYGDLVGNLEKLEKTQPHAGAVVLEWDDFDSRLGLRTLGGWSPKRLPDVLETVRARAQQIAGLLRQINVPVVLSLPTLPLPPISFTSPWQDGTLEIELRKALQPLYDLVIESQQLRLVSAQKLHLLSPLNERLDIKTTVQSGFPYRLPHASALAEMLAQLLSPRAPYKGLITDLDNTLWRGILGDDGIAGVTWDLDHKSQMHGLYQQMLQSLAEAGVLIAVASKNDPRLVEEVWQRDDLLLRRDRVFPCEAHWGPKSESVRRILNAWNIGADSVVFVDDSPLELAEVGAAFPALRCVSFPTQDWQAAYELLVSLRDLFGRETLSQEDEIRLESLRRAQSFQVEATTQSPDEFLAQLDAEIIVSFRKPPADTRAFELINKTNQFNLNGKRYTEADWATFLRRPDSFLMEVSYQDKFGPLGKIGVVAGSRAGNMLQLDTWVMSCRAFSRRIEHQCLAVLFDRYEADDITFDFQATTRNGPLQEFFTGLLGDLHSPPLRLTRNAFRQTAPPLFHQVKEQPNDRYTAQAHSVF